MATPKQIRELMKVDGLTNDEVKSHLQVWKSRIFFFPHFFFFFNSIISFPKKKKKKKKI